tara:strand:+ start:215 stop:1315 length:1101 start_codon:yes stop_codon:yes gene_type:complete
MANMNIRTPRFYIDRVNYLLNRGIGSSHFKIESTNASDNTVGMNAGFDNLELFDMKPLNQVTFDTNSSSAKRQDHVIISIDDRFGSRKTNFVAILNHNMHSANSKFKIVFDASTESHVQAENFPDANRVQATQVFNGAVADDSVNDADGNAHKIITPSADGHTIITFDEISARFIGIQFEGSRNSGDSGAGNYFDGSNDLAIGCILVGEFYDMPHSPDLAIKRSIKYDKQKIQESLGGQRYSNITSFGRTLTSTGSKSPFHTYDDSSSGFPEVYGGRITYDMKFSYLSSDKIMPTTYNVANQGDDTVVSDIWNLTHGNHTPFIFTQDGTSTSESDYLFARFAQNSLDMTQVAPDVFDISMKIEEEF